VPELKEPEPQYDSTAAQPRLFATEIETESGGEVYRGR
jgi:hypothetical protein